MARNRIYFGGEIAVKYGCDWGGWSSREVPSSYGVSLWKYRRHGGNSFSRFLKFDIGDGTQVKFWYDLWCGDYPLKVEFPEFFGIARNKNALIVDLLWLPDGVIYWDLYFT